MRNLFRNIGLVLGVIAAMCAVTLVASPAGAVSPETTISTAYTTAYGYGDNTPASNEISNPTVHSVASGTGTYADPVTVAVGHSITNGVDTLDYAAGTRFYVPNVQKYFVAEDTCGDGATPQNIGCHKLFGTANGNDAPAGATKWIDLWVGGRSTDTYAVGSPLYNCEEAVTSNAANGDLHKIIVNPANNYKVTSGDIFQSATGACQTGYGDTVQTVTYINPNQSIITTAYTQAYSYWDTGVGVDPVNSAPILHTNAAGAGTYSDPVTIQSPIDTSGHYVYAPGTKMYVPNVRRYFKVEDGDTGLWPQTNVDGSGSTTQVAMWIGGQGFTAAQAAACESALTALHTIVLNPNSNYAVASGYGVMHTGNSCNGNYGDTLVTQ